MESSTDLLPSQETNASEVIGAWVLDKTYRIQETIYDRVYQNRGCIVSSLDSYNLNGKHGFLTKWHTGIGLDLDRVDRYFARLDTRTETYYIGFYGPLSELARFQERLEQNEPLISHSRKRVSLYSDDPKSRFLDLSILDRYRTAMDHFSHPLASLSIILQRIGCPRTSIEFRTSPLKRGERQPLTVECSIRDLYRS